MSSTHMAALTNRSIRNIVSELEFLADTNIISATTLRTIVEQLPEAGAALNISAATLSLPTPAPGPVPHTSTPAISHPTFSPPPSTKTPLSGKYLPVAAQAPPSPPPPPSYTPTPLVLSLANAEWTFVGSEKGDLAFKAGDTIEVLEKVKDDWWRGRIAGGNGEIGLFPSSYVKETRVLAGKEKAPLPSLPPRAGNNGYGPGGNMMTDVAHGNGGQQQQEGGGGIVGKNGEKFGKKLGNAAIFGAGATIGTRIVNGIF
ncbi:SH3-domain-containing protein [Tuber magnatum]|uniref:SH3-domain-containing protein n=1 Tax=Tuber magnatum TaxID=42249 RepID=A0A317SMU2_9PEZI|nr:SH3-domain-containing protein [Tuber magnatum]